MLSNQVGVSNAYSRGVWAEGHRATWMEPALGLKGF